MRNYFTSNAPSSEGDKRGGTMAVAELVLRYVEVLVWPVTVTVLLFTYRDAIVAILPTSKIKVSLYGFEIETTLQELKDVTLATLGGDLSSRQRNLLEEIAKEGPKSFEKGEIPKEDRKWIRPIMNAGLIMTQPAEVHLVMRKAWL